MQEIVRKLFLGFIHVHILHHAKREPFFGSWMIEELKQHGYEISAGTLYPILHNLEKIGLLSVETQTSNGKVRKYYTITQQGELAFEDAKKYIRELSKEIIQCES